MKTKEEAEKRALDLFPMQFDSRDDYINSQRRKAYIQCFDDMQSSIVSFGNFLLADRGDGNYLMSKKYVTQADLENWKNEQ